jgi:CTP synthase
MTQFIFVTGGVISGLGKGVTIASLGSILQMLGVKRITIKKLDPYLNVDPGTMNPKEHGEVFVTRDGKETDLDLGYYERFLSIEMTEKNSSSSGKLFQQLLTNERNGLFLGKTVQMIPHFTNMIKDFITQDSELYDIILCEIGGSVGDIESIAFYEAIRQLKNQSDIENVLFVHLTYLLYYPITDELKTKPTQNAIRELQQLGITPDILVCRSEHPVPPEIKDKLSLYTNLSVSHIIDASNDDSIYTVPLSFIKENVHLILKDKLNLSGELNSKKWVSLNNKIKSLTESTTIGILGKYTDLNDSYKSLLESIAHAGLHWNRKIKIEWLSASQNVHSKLNTLQGLVIPGGFGEGGVESMLEIIELARRNKLPTLGICFGMQLMVIEFFRNCLGIKGAGSAEFENCSPNVITKMKQWESSSYGGTMRLGNCSVQLSEHSKIKDIYGQTTITERHRHRYDVNSKEPLLEEMENLGLRITGKCSNHGLIEVVEMNETLHPWYIGVQYHPEYQSSPFDPHPLFLSFLQSTL